MSQSKQTKHTTPTNNKGPESYDLGMLFIVLALFVLGLAFFINDKRGAQNESSVSEVSPLNSPYKQREAFNRVEKNLKEGYLRSLTQREELENESYTAEHIDANGLPNDGDKKVNPLIIEQENAAQKVLNDTEADALRRTQQLTPDQRISSKLERDAWSRDYNRKLEEEYKRQFIENARRQGLNIRLNKNMDITGIDSFPVEEPVRIPQSEPRGSR